MSVVGIIANPAAGQDIRRLVTHASVIGNDEKVRIVRRLLAGLDTVGVERVWIMPDAYGIGLKALDGLALRLEAGLLEMSPHFDQEDSTRAAALMVARGVRCLITLGGDGTNRAVAKGCGAVPLVPLSTGTNNVFPFLIEATIGGLAAGLVATGRAEAAVAPSPRIEVFRGLADDAAVPPDAVPDDLALVDVAVYDEWFIGARAVLDSRRIRAVVLARTDPGIIGLASLGAHLTGRALPAGAGLYLRLGDGGQPVTAPIAPGMIATVGIVEQRRLAPGELVVVRQPTAWVLAFDGERDLEVKRGEGIGLRVTPRGPRVADPRLALGVAARAGAFTGGLAPD